MFFPEDYKKLSEKLIDKISIFTPYNEAVIRTSISRAYYYIFLELRETFLVNLPKQDREAFIEYINHHILLQEVLFQIGKFTKNIDFIKASKTLKQMRRIRNTADYNISEGITKENYIAIEIEISSLEEVAGKIKTIPREVLSSALNKAVEHLEME